MKVGVHVARPNAVLAGYDLVLIAREATGGFMLMTSGRFWWHSFRIPTLSRVSNDNVPARAS